MLTVERLKEVLNFKEGKFYWKIKGKGISSKGCRAGSLRNTGYRAIRIDTKIYQEHQLVWLYHHGELMAGKLDHINNIRDDNRLCNLRLASRSQNAMNRVHQSNNTSGVIGVFKRKDTGKWCAYLGKGKVLNGQKVIKSGRTYLGNFDTIEEAAQVRKEAEIKLFGEFRNEN